MADARSIVSTLLYCLWWPVGTVLQTLAIILSPFWAVAHFIFLPAVYLVHGIYSILALPFRLHIVERIETIYIWLGVAGLIGCIAGAILFLASHFLSSALKIDGSAEARPRADRTAEEFRAPKAAKKSPRVESPSGPRIDKVAALRRRDLLSQPNHEVRRRFERTA